MCGLLACGVPRVPPFSRALLATRGLPHIYACGAAYTADRIVDRRSLWSPLLSGAVFAALRLLACGQADVRGLF